jgi:hypothetical protein
VLPELFLLFFPPFLLWVWPLGAAFLVVAGLSVEAGVPVVPWAIESVAPSNMANAIVSSFFMQSPSVEVSFYKQSDSGGYWRYCTRESRKRKKRPAMRPLVDRLFRKLFRRWSCGVASALLGFFCGFFRMAMFLRFCGASLCGISAACRWGGAACLSKAHGGTKYQCASDCE